MTPLSRHETLEVGSTPEKRAVIKLPKVQLT